MTRLFIVLLTCFAFVVPLTALTQDQAVLSLVTATASLQTGQEYEITIRVDNAPDFWTTDLRLNYDPTLIYVIGTKAGSPVTAGEMFQSANSVVVQNLVQEDQVAYVVSKVGETTPATGGGIIGSFRIYPIAPGQTQITFSRAQIVGLTSYDPNASDVGTVQIPATVVLLDLTITGSPVEPPAEATATPTPTETPTPFGGIGVQVNQQPTLVNVTAAPTTSPIQEAPAESISPALVLALGIMLLGGIGIVVMLVIWRRGRR